MSPQPKLNNEQVEMIRADKRTYRIIADSFGISAGAVWKIKTGVIWNKRAAESVPSSPTEKVASCLQK